MFPHKGCFWGRPFGTAQCLRAAKRNLGLSSKACLESTFPSAIVRRKQGAALKIILCALFACLLAATAQAAPVHNKITPGELVIDPPTLINLGFEWLVEGDD